MAKLKKIRKKLLIPFWKTILITAVFGFLVLLVIANFRIYQERQALSLKVKALEEEMAEFSNKDRILKEQISEVQFSKNLEKVAREELNFQKEGENVVAFPDLEPKAFKEESPEERNLWQKFLDKITQK